MSQGFRAMRFCDLGLYGIIRIRTAALSRVAAREPLVAGCKSDGDRAGGVWVEVC
jgi:hypothetical protein